MIAALDDLSADSDSHGVSDQTDFISLCVSQHRFEESTHSFEQSTAVRSELFMSMIITD